MKLLNLNQVKLNWIKCTADIMNKKVNKFILPSLFAILIVLCSGYLWTSQNSNIEKFSDKIDNLSQRIKTSQESAAKINKDKNIGKGENLELAKLEKDVLSIEKDEVNAKNAVYANIIQALGSAFFFITAYLTWRNLIATEEKLITERISKAVEQLGSEKSQIVIGGIYSLERISQDSQKDYWTILEILTSFTRGKLLVDKLQNHRDLTSEEIQQIQEIIIIIGRRNLENDKGRSLNLSSVNLESLNLSHGDFTKVNFQNSLFTHANLNGANFTHTNLTNSNFSFVNCNFKGVAKSIKFIEADLTKANFDKAILRFANFTTAIMHEAILTDAQLEATNLTDAKLTNANLARANLSGANLSRAILSGATLKNADLTNANLTTAKDLTTKQVREAKNYKFAQYNEHFTKKLQQEGLI